MFVIVVISGVVLWESHSRLPMILLICRMVLSDACVDGDLIASTGKPLRYGVGDGFAD